MTRAPARPRTLREQSFREDGTSELWSPATRQSEKRQRLFSGTKWLGGILRMARRQSCERGKQCSCNSGPTVVQSWLDMCPKVTLRVFSENVHQFLDGLMVMASWVRQRRGRGLLGSATSLGRTPLSDAVGATADVFTTSASAEHVVGNHTVSARFQGRAFQRQ